MLILLNISDDSEEYPDLILSEDEDDISSEDEDEMTRDIFRGLSLKHR